MTTLLQTIIPVDSITVHKEFTFGELIKDGNYEQVLDNAVTWGIDFLANILISVLIFIIGRFLIKKIDKLTVKLLKKTSWDNVLKGFILTFNQTLLYVILILVIINTVGVKTVSVAAIIAAIGLAVGLAMKDNLSNFAGGVMILLSKPFKGGDYITAQNLEGRVDRIGMMHTTLKTADNKTVFIPNGPLSRGNIINNSGIDGILRSAVVVNIKYGCNIDEVKSLMEDIALEHPKVLKTPEPSVKMTKININTLELTMRVWTLRNDLASVTHDLTETVYKKLYDKGVIG